MEVKTILGKQELSKTDLVALLDCRDTTEAELFRHSRQLRDATIGNGVHMRGLIEISNVCIKDCLYCGIRKSNSQAQRYELNDEEIVEAAIFAYRNHYGSVVLQGGERHDPAFILRIERLVREIKHLSNQRLGITLSLGEQTEDTYRRWFDAGAHSGSKLRTNHSTEKFILPASFMIFTPGWNVSAAFSVAVTRPVQV